MTEKLLIVLLGQQVKNEAILTTLKDLLVEDFAKTTGKPSSEIHEMVNKKMMAYQAESTKQLAILVKAILPELDLNIDAILKS